MFFPKDVPYKNIKEWITFQLPPVFAASKDGIIVEIKPYKPKRTNAQNKFLMEIMVEIVRFYHKTGYIVPGLEAWAMQPLILKEYWKARYGVEHSSQIDPKDFSAFIDFIQNTMVEETGGEWEILTTDSAYIKSLIEDGYTAWKNK